MEFSPFNKIIKTLLTGISFEENGNTAAAIKTFQELYGNSIENYEKFLSAYFIARNQKSNNEKLNWFKKAQDLALQSKEYIAVTALPNLYEQMAKTSESLGDDIQAKTFFQLAQTSKNYPPDPGPFYHGTRVYLKPGDYLNPGGQSNYKPDLKMNHIYFTASLTGAGLAASLAKGDGNERIYMVVPTGVFEDDPNVTNKKFPGNPTRSYRSAFPLKITGEMQNDNPVSEKDIENFKNKVNEGKGDIIN